MACGKTKRIYYSCANGCIDGEVFRNIIESNSYRHGCMIRWWWEEEVKFKNSLNNESKDFHPTNSPFEPVRCATCGTVAIKEFRTVDIIVNL